MLFGLAAGSASQALGRIRSHSRALRRLLYLRGLPRYLRNSLLHGATPRNMLVSCEHTALGNTGGIFEEQEV